MGLGLKVTGFSGYVDKWLSIVKLDGMINSFFLVKRIVAWLGLGYGPGIISLRNVFAPDQWVVFHLILCFVVTAKNGIMPVGCERHCLLARFNKRYLNFHYLVRSCRNVVASFFQIKNGNYAW